MLLVDKRESDEDLKMRKATIRSLTAKGYSQKRIAKTLGIRKMKVVTAQKALKIGKRAEQPFWRDVKGIVEMKGKTWKQAKMEVKYSKKWFGKRQKRLTGIKKARDIIGEKTQRIKEGEIPDDWFTTEEGEELMEYVGYD